MIKQYLTLSLILCLVGASAQKQMEHLDRGIVAVRTSPEAVFISWRLLGHEYEDVGFNIYRGGDLLNAAPISNTTQYIGSTYFDYSYTIVPVIGGEEQAASGAALPWAKEYRTIPLQRPSGGRTDTGQNYTYNPNDCSVGDLDGGGDYEIIVKWQPSNAHDNAHNGYTGNVFLDAYTMEGEQLWRIDLGKNIRAGAHYTQFMVYDLDGDGKAELACKTADGTTDGKGNVIGDPSADHRNYEGRILYGPEFLSIFNGETGEAMVTTEYVPPRGLVDDWGDDYGNRVDRFLAGIAYLDGQRPSLVMCRGYYTRTVLAAWDWRDGALTQRWVFDTDEAYSSYAGQGAHSLTIGDVDHDGRDEITYGACAIDDDGKGLYTTGLGHGDALHLTDMDPQRPGQEVFMVHETPIDYGSHGLEMRDAQTGEILWSRSGNGRDVGRGVAMDIDPNYLGYEAWGSVGGLVAANGQQISDRRPSSINFGAWWDGDLVREILNGTTIKKWNYNTLSEETILDVARQDACAINGTKSTPCLSADIFGDWREEIIWRHHENDKLMIFTTTIPTKYRLPTLMHDTQYRTAIAWQNVGYNQPPHPSYYLGTDMSYPDIMDIETGAAVIHPSINLGIDNSHLRNRLHWYSSPTLRDYRIYRSLVQDVSTGALIIEVSNDVVSYIDDTILSDQAYYYWIEAVDINDNVVRSNIVNSYSTKPSLILSAEALSEKVQLSWQMIGEIGDTVTIYRGLNPNSSDRVQIALLLDASTTFIDDNVVNGATYFYWIESKNKGLSIISNMVSAIPQYILTIEEGESGFCGIDGTIDSNHDGYNGLGFANTYNEIKSGIDYQVTVGNDGEYRIGCRYANGDDASRPMLVRINGEEKGIIEGATTYSWTNWAQSNIEVFLESGDYRIRLEALSGSGLANIDNMSIAGQVVSPLACDIKVQVESINAKSGLNIYPNPSTNIFYLDYPDDIVDFKIYHSSGALVDQGQLSGQPKTLGKKLTPGVYFITLFAKNKRTNQMIIKL